MSAAFTKGPWRVTPYGTAGREHSVQVASGGSQICGPANTANARLIAAAPDGYEAGEEAVTALNAMMKAWFDYHDAHSLTQPVTGAAGNAFDKALAAREKLEAFIAKARGDQ